VKAANGTATPSASAATMSDPKVLRQKLEEQRARNVSATSLKDDAKQVVINKCQNQADKA
jgi:hypothetical protein